MVLNLRPKCANPSCAAPFQWLAGGRLFRFDREVKANGAAASEQSSSPTHRPVGHFWLCEHCSNIYTLKYQAGRGVVISTLWPELPAAKNEMRLPSP